jgi:hypothetical protein
MAIWGAKNLNQGCKTPEELWSNTDEQQQMEREIERVIIGHFRGDKAAQGAIDIFTDPAINGPQTVTDWLSRNSFGRVINKKQMMDGFAQKKYSVPDIITNRGALGKSEFYEIKPNSDKSVKKGISEVTAFTQLNTDFNLLFFPGTEYDPNMSVPFNPVDIAGETYDVELKWFRHGLGLIVYELCYRRRRKQEQEQEAPSSLLEMALLLLLGTILFIMLKGRPLPNFNPAAVPFGPPVDPYSA